MPQLKTLTVVNCPAIDDDPAPFLKLSQVENMEVRGKRFSKATLNAIKQS